MTTLAVAMFLGATKAQDAVAPPIIFDDSCDPCNGFDQYVQDPISCECKCAIMCGAIYQLDVEACTCIPIKGQEDDPKYKQYWAGKKFAKPK